MINSECWILNFITQSCLVHPSVKLYVARMFLKLTLPKLTFPVSNKD